MAYAIDPDICTSCGACELECPNGAIRTKGGVYIIDAGACSECEGHFDHPQCDTVCPEDGAVVPA